MVPLRNGRGSALIQQLNFTTSIKWLNRIDLLVIPSLLSRYIWNLRASISQESKQRIRQESKLPVSGSPAHRHAQCPIAALTLCWQIVLWHAWKSVFQILWEWQVSGLFCENNKYSLSYVFCIFSIFLWIFTFRTVPPQRSARTSMKASKSKQRTGYWYPVAWVPVYDPDESKLPTQAMKVI